MPTMHPAVAGYTNMLPKTTCESCPTHQVRWQCTLCLKNVPPLICYNLDILKLTIRLRKFLAVMLQRNVKCEEVWIVSHFTYLVLQHYHAKEETQKTANWCFGRATQSNCCSAFGFLSTESCPLTAPSWTYWLQDLGSRTAAWVWVVSQRDWRNQAATG